MRARLKELAVKQPAYGYLLLNGLLKADRLLVNRKRSYLIPTEEGFQVRTKERRKLLRPGLLMQDSLGVSQRLSMDFVSDRLISRRFFRVLNVVDDYSREVSGQLFFKRFIECCGKPSKIVCDSGTKLTSKAILLWISKTSIKPGSNSFENQRRKPEWEIPELVFKPPLI